MDSEEGPQPGRPQEEVADEPPAEAGAHWTTPSRTAPSRGTNLRRIFVGAIVTFIAISLGYGVQNAVTMVALAVICTVGVGLIPILFLSWMVGWVVIAVWQAIMRMRQGAPSTP
jgi:hypothetical protein